MLPVSRQADHPMRMNSVNTRTDTDNWSQWTHEEEEEPLSPAYPTEDLADLVRKSQLALSTLQPVTPNSPVRFQDDRGSIYYEYDDDWVSTISPIDRVPSRRFERVPSFFRRMGHHNSRPTTAADEDPQSIRLHSAGCMAKRNPSTTQSPWQRMPSRGNSTRRGHLDVSRNPFERVGYRMSSNPSTISEGQESALDPAEVSLFSQSDRISERSLSDDGNVFNGLKRSQSDLDLSFGEGTARAVGTQTRRPTNSWGLPNPPSYPASESMGFNDNKKGDHNLFTTDFTAKRHVSFGEVEFPSDHKTAMISENQDLHSNQDGSTSPPLPPRKQEGPSETTVSAPVHGLGLVAMTFALALAVFIVGVDINIVSTAIPEITKDFGSVEDIGWYGSAFLLTTCAFQIPWGRLYTLLPTKWTFTAATVIFEIGSLICGASQSSIAFIIGRAVQGMGVAGMLSGALIIMSLVVPLPKRSLLGGIIGAMEGVAMISAPLIGGVLTDHASWRWCFYINLPIGAVVLVVIIVFLRVPPQPLAPELRYMSFSQRVVDTLKKLDLVGTAVLIPCIVCVLLAMQWGGVKYDWNSLGIILLFVLSFVLLCVLIYMQSHKGDNAMVPSRILKQRTVISGFWFMLCTSSALVVMAYFLPLWFQVIRKDTPSESGLHMLPMILGVIVAVLASGGLVTAVGYYAPFMILGTVLMSVGAGLLSTFSPSTSAALRIVYPALFGLGVGLSFQQPIIAAQTVLSEEDVPLGTTVIVFGQSIGAAIVISIANSVFANRVTSSISDIVGGMEGLDTEDILNGITGGDSSGIADAGGSAEEITNALNKAITQSYYVALAMAALSIIGAVFVEWRSVKKPKEVADKADGQPLMETA